MEDNVSIVTLEAISSMTTLPLSRKISTHYYPQHFTQHQNHSVLVPTSRKVSDGSLQIELVETTSSDYEQRGVRFISRDKKNSYQKRSGRRSTSEGSIDLSDIVSVESEERMTCFSHERVSLDNEDGVCSVEQDCYRNTLAGTDHPALRVHCKQAAKPERELTEDEAATKIQSTTVEGEAARYVQYYFRKWKMRTIFQTLQTYRADRQQQLVYFSQQVHLYSQELQAKMQRLNLDLDLGKVRNEATGAHKTILARAPSAMPKLALDHTLNAYFDTSYLCDPARARKGRGCDDDWEAPFKSKQTAASMARSHNMGIDQRSEERKDQAPSAGIGYNQNLGVKSRTAMFNQGGNEYNNNYSSSSNNTGYNRFAGSSNTPKNQGYNRFAGSNMSKPSSATPVYNKYGGSYLNNAKSQAPKPPVVVNSWNDRGSNGYSNNNYDGGDTGGTHDFRKHLRRTNIHAEMEARSRRSDSGEDAPFNFQGMLRKTNVTRDSLRRTPSPVGAYYEPPRSYNDTPREDTPTFTEETEEAML